MPPAWKAHLARVRQATDAAFGEGFIATPVKASQYKDAAVDPARPAFEFVAVPNVEGEKTSGFAQFSSENRDARYPVGETHIYVDPDRWPAILGLKAGDIITAKDSGSVRYSVQHVQRRRRNRIELRLAVV